MCIYLSDYFLKLALSILCFEISHQGSVEIFFPNPSVNSITQKWKNCLICHKSQYFSLRNISSAVGLTPGSLWKIKPPWYKTPINQFAKITSPVLGAGPETGEAEGPVESIYKELCRKSCRWRTGTLKHLPSKKSLLVALERLKQTLRWHMFCFLTTNLYGIYTYQPKLWQ